MELSLSVIWNSGTFPRNEKTIIFLHVLMFPGQHLSKRRRAEYFMALRRNVEHFKGFGSANRAALKFRCLLLTFPWEDQSRRLQSPSDFSRSDPSCADSYVFLLTLAFSAKKTPLSLRLHRPAGAAKASCLTLVLSGRSLESHAVTGVQ